jgi:hypothetical protein
MSVTEEQIQAGARAMCSLNAIRQSSQVEFARLDVREREHWEDLARVCLTVALPPTQPSSDMTAEPDFDLKSYNWPEYLRQMIARTNLDAFDRGELHLIANTLEKLGRASAAAPPPLDPATIEAVAQALANDAWHPPVSLDALSSYEARKFRRQARIVLDAIRALGGRT